MSEKDQQESFFEEGEEQEYQKVQEDKAPPIVSEPQLAVNILKTHARTSNPNTIHMKIIRQRVPVFGTQQIKDKNGNIKDVPFVERYKIEEWKIPILIQPKYHELITDDLSKAFLSEGDLEVSRTNMTYCKLIQSFADRYEIDLSMHHNNFVDETNYLVVSSGAFKGKRVMLAKTNIAEQTTRQTLNQFMTQQDKDKKKGFLDKMLNP